MSIKSELHEMIKKRGGTPPAHGGVAAALDVLNELPSGVTSWNDLEDKPFGVETTESYTTRDSDLSFYVRTTGGGKLYKTSDPADGACLSSESDWFEVGAKYRITINGVQYTSDRAKMVEDDTDVYVNLFDSNGNSVGRFGTEETAGYAIQYAWRWDELVEGYSGTLTVEKISEAETVNPIDPKYIVLTSPNGTKYNLAVADDGTLSAVAAE